jgi:hypothetical protein
MRVPLPKHVGHSLLRHPKSRSRTLYGGSAMKVVTSWAEGLGIEVPLANGSLVCGLV